MFILNQKYIVHKFNLILLKLNNKNLEKQLLNSQADIVFHMAAQSILSK